MIKRATKKPVTIEYVEWDGENYIELIKFIAGNGEAWLDGEANLVVGTLEGPHVADIGDMIIKGVAGEFYPCKPDIFAKTYTIDKGE